MLKLSPSIDYYHQQVFERYPELKEKSKVKTTCVEISEYPENITLNQVLSDIRDKGKQLPNTDYVPSILTSVQFNALKQPYSTHFTEVLKQYGFNDYEANYIDPCANTKHLDAIASPLLMQMQYHIDSFYAGTITIARTLHAILIWDNVQDSISTLKSLLPAVEPTIIDNFYEALQNTAYYRRWFDTNNRRFFPIAKDDVENKTPQPAYLPIAGFSSLHALYASPDKRYTYFEDEANCHAVSVDFTEFFNISENWENALVSDPGYFEEHYKQYEEDMLCSTFYYDDTNITLSEQFTPLNALDNYYNPTDTDAIPPAIFYTSEGYSKNGLVSFLNKSMKPTDLSYTELFKKIYAGDIAINSYADYLADYKYLLNQQNMSTFVEIISSLRLLKSMLENDSVFFASYIAGRTYKCDMTKVVGLFFTDYAMSYAFGEVTGDNLVDIHDTECREVFAVLEEYLPLLLAGNSWKPFISFHDFMNKTEFKKLYSNDVLLTECTEILDSFKLTSKRLSDIASSSYKFNIARSGFLMEVGRSEYYHEELPNGEFLELKGEELEYMENKADYIFSETVKDAETFMLSKLLLDPLRQDVDEDKEMFDMFGTEFSDVDCFIPSPQEYPGIDPEDLERLGINLRTAYVASGDLPINYVPFPCTVVGYHNVKDNPPCYIQSPALLYKLYYSEQGFEPSHGESSQPLICPLT